MFRSAFVALKPAINQSFVIEQAIARSLAHGWGLQAVSVVDADYVNAAEPVPLGAGAIKLERDQQRLEQANRRAAAVVNEFVEDCQARQVAAEANVRVGNTVELLARESQRSDLLVLGHSGGDDTGDESLLFKILKHSSRPAMIVPREPTVGQGIIVAYDGSFQASRALASFAYSGLAGKEPVHILTFHSDTAAGGELADRARGFLARHRIASVSLVESDRSSAAERILTQARQLGAGLLVMGAFGQSTMRDFLFGSVTRTILHRLPVPVFLDH